MGWCIPGWLEGSNENGRKEHGAAQRLARHPGPAERTVALLVFEDVRASPLADLMDVAQRQKTASELNAAILASQSQASRRGWEAEGGRQAACQCVARQQSGMRESRSCTGG